MKLRVQQQTTFANIMLTLILCKMDGTGTNDRDLEEDGKM